MMKQLLWFLAILAMAQSVRAQVVEDIEVKREGPEAAVVTIRFSVRIQYLRSSQGPKKDLVQVFFRVIAGEEDGSRTIQEFRNSPPQDLVPKFTVNYPFMPGNGPRRLDIQFERPVTARVRPGADGRTLRIEMPAPKVATAPAPKAATAAPKAPPAKTGAAAALPPPASVAPETSAKAAELFSKARADLDAGRVDAAIEGLNELLNMPPSPIARAAQELIGVARERHGDLAKARAEYELFLKLFPQGPDADRVRARLAALGKPATAPSTLPELAAAAPPPPPKFTTWGGVSQYYYGGQSSSQTQVTVITPATNATTIDTFSLTSKDQSLISTNIDLNARYTAGNWDDRMVFRDTYDYSLLKDQPNRDRMSALYAEVNHRPSRSLLRLGRQTATTGGVLGRFDGALAGYGLTPGLRLNAVGGRAVDEFLEAKPTFYGAALDIESGTPAWSGTVYALRQRLRGLNDRSTVGGEVRYFDARYTMFGTVDYDVSFKAVNIGMLQATWQSPWGSSVNFLGDYRRSPSLALSNALLTGRNLTLQQFVETFGESGTRSQALAATPISKVIYVGLTHPFSPRWQVGFDLRVSSLGGTPEIGLMPALPSTGNVYTTSAQLIGTGLFGSSDVLVVNASHLTGSLLTGLSIGITERLQFDKWIFEPSLRYYRQRDTNDVRTSRWSPSLKLAYKARERLTLEAEATVERTRTNGPTIDDETTRRFYFLGYRWDF